MSAFELTVVPLAIMVDAKAADMTNMTKVHLKIKIGFCVGIAHCAREYICICNHNEDVDPTRGRLPCGSCGRSRLEMERWLDTENVPPITNG